MAAARCCGAGTSANWRPRGDTRPKRAGAARVRNAANHGRATASATPPHAPMEAPKLARLCCGPGSSGSENWGESRPPRKDSHATGTPSGKSRVDASQRLAMTAASRTTRAGTGSRLLSGQSFGRALREAGRHQHASKQHACNQQRRTRPPDQSRSPRSRSPYSASSASCASCACLAARKRCAYVRIVMTASACPI